MTWEFTPYAVALISSAGLMLVLVRVAWPYRTAAGGSSLVGLLIAMGVYALGLGFEAAAVGVPAKLIWAVLEYPGLVAYPVFYLFFCLDYTRQSHWAPAGLRAWLWVIPLSTVIVAATNDWHHWLWTSFTPAPNNALLYGHGPWWWLLVVYGYSLTLSGTIALAAAIVRFPGLYRRQAGALLISFLVPFLGNVIYVAGRSPFSGLDVGPFTFLITAVGLTWSVVRHDLLTLLPVAHDSVVESMQDGVLVVDPHGRVVVANAVFRSWLNLQPEVIGQSAESVLARWPLLRERLAGMGAESAELSLEGPPVRHLDLRLAWLANHAGRVIALRDITDRKRAEAQAQQANQRLQGQLATIEALQASLREQAVRDPLTGLFNRRYLEETLDRELARAQRDATPLSVVMLDIDHFKLLNDRHGHAAGDQVLRSLGALLTAQTRAGDIACRYGGEEFLVVLPSASAEMARERVEAWRLTFAAFTWEEANPLEAQAPVQATFSAGVAAWPEHAAEGAELRRCADQALYRAKETGRNRVCVSAPDHAAPAEIA